MDKITLNISSIETFGTHEGPGIRFVIFTQGCNFRCLYCHNPETQSKQGGYKIDIDDLFKQIIKNKPYFRQKGGVTISGGEPLLQSESLIPLFLKLKNEGVNTAIDTNGSILNENTKKLLELTDLVLLDIKQTEPVMFFEITGTIQTDIFFFAQYLEQKNIKFWIRYVLVPDLTDQKKSLDLLINETNKYENLERIELLPYHDYGMNKYDKLDLDYKLKNNRVATAEDIKRAESILSRSLKPVFIR